MIKFNDNIPQSSRVLIELILQNQKFKHHVIKAELSTLGVRGEMKADIKSKEDVKIWLETFETATNTTYRVNYTKPSVGVWILYKLGVKCHHNTGGKKLNSDQNRSCKNTKCPSRITFTVNAIPKKVFKRNCYVDPDLPTVIDFYYEHNHPINSADVLRFRPVDSSVEDKLMELYQKGHSPGSALQILKIDLENEHPNDFETYLADRKYCPDLSFCHRLFYKKFKNKQDTVNILESREFLLEKVREYNQMCNMTCVKVTEPPDDFVLAICTPLMFRIHQTVPQAAEIIFLDAAGCVKEKEKSIKNSKDKEIGHRMFLLSTYNSTGCLPLGVIITMSDSPDIIYKGLEVYKSLLPLGGNYFYGRGEMGPAVIMTDDTIAERVALNMSWRFSTLLLCTFHVLQSMWRWLMKSKNCIKKEDRTVLFETFKAVVYASTEVKCLEYYEKLKYSAKDYSFYLSHISGLWERRSEWALCYRSSSTLVIRENSIHQNINNVTKILKDEIFERVKSFNLAQLADFIFTRFESYYCRKLLDVAYDRVVQKKSKDKKPYWKSPTDTILKSIRELDSGVYSVPSESDPENLHTVDVQLVCCTCSVGRNGILCKHQYWVSLIIDKTREQKSLDFRKHSYYLAKGEEANDMWLLHNTGTTPSAQQTSNDEDTPSAIETDSQTELWNEGLKIIQEKLSYNNNQVEHLLTQFIENLKNLPSNSEDVLQAFHNFGKTKEDTENIITEMETTTKIKVRRQKVTKKQRKENIHSDDYQIVPAKRKREKCSLELNNKNIIKSDIQTVPETQHPIASVVDTNNMDANQKCINIISNDQVNVKSVLQYEKLNSTTHLINLKDTATFPNYYDPNSLRNGSKTMYNISTEP